MIALGVPGSPTSAVIMAGLFIWGLTPGPLLFVEHHDFVWGLIASIYLGHLLTFVICLSAVPLLAMIMRIPYAILTPFIILISIIGSYSLNNSMLDVFITIAFGLVGYWLRKMKYPLAPLVVAIVLGDSTERTFRQSLIGSGGNPSVFLGTPLAASLMILAVALLLLPLVRTLRGRARPASEIAEDTISTAID
jgi:putative tricarboxylic transport membrane protein